MRRRGKGMPQALKEEFGITGETQNGHKPNDPHTPTHDELRDRFTDRHPDHGYGLGEWRHYAEGVWRPIPELTVKQQMAPILEGAKPEGIRPTAGLLSSVAELARVKLHVPDESWDADPDALVCQNGALHIPTRRLREHRRDDFATSAVPYDYDPPAAAPIWRVFLKGTVAHAADFLQEFAGYCLTTDTDHETAVWLHGPPGSGRSTFLAGLEAMLGHRAGVLGLAELERSRFALANLEGKTLMTATEQPSSYLASTNILNAIISGEPLPIERKYRDPYTITPRAKLCWAMNELPRVADANSGLFRRVKVVEFPALDPDDRDPAIKAEIKNEGAGILNWALDGLERLRERGCFEVPEAIEYATSHFKEANDIPAMFVAEKCLEDPYFSEKASELYTEYKEWCIENGHRPQSSTRVADDWRRLGFERYRSKGATRYRGVRLRLPRE